MTFLQNHPVGKKLRTGSPDHRKTTVENWWKFSIIDSSSNSAVKLIIVELTKTFGMTDKLLCDDLEDWKCLGKCEELKNGLGASGNLKVGFRGLNEVENVRTWLLEFLKSVE